MVSLISGLNEEALNSSQLKKGILWQQRDKIFSRWKERFFVLTNDYLQCYKKGTSRITEMGGFIYGLRLSEVRTVIQDFEMCFLVNRLLACDLPINKNARLLREIMQLVLHD